MNRRAKNPTGLNEASSVKIKLHPLVKIFLKLAVTSAALWYVFSRLELQQVLSTIAGSRFLLLTAALILFALSKVISAVRLKGFLESAGIHISQAANMKLYLLGMYYNLFLPGGIGGDGYKIYLLNRKYDVPGRKIFWAVMIDRIIGVLALFWLAVLLFCFLPDAGSYSWFIWILIPLSLLLCFLLFRRFFPYFLGFFVRSNLLSMAVQILQLGAAGLILLSLHETSMFGAYLFVFLLSSMVAVLPLTIGGIGSREFAFMLGAQWLGLDLNLSIALSFLFYLLTAFTSFWGIIFSLGPGIRLEDEA